MYLLNGQIVFQFVGNGFVKDAGQHPAEQPGNYKNQNHNKYRRCKIEKKAAGRNHRNKKAVNTHFFKTHHIFPDKAVIVQHGTEHFSQLFQNQYRKNAGEEEKQAERVVVFFKVAVESSIKFDAQRKCGSHNDSGIKHQIQQKFGEKCQSVFHKNASFL